MIEASPSAPWPRALSPALPSLALVAVAYFVAAKLGLRLAYLHPSATPVWPPTGIALGVLLVLGYRAWPAIWAGAFLANLTTAGTLATSLGIAMGNTAEALAGAFLVNRFADGRHAMERAWNIFKFAVLAAGASTTISATIGVATLAIGGFVEPGTATPVWLTWWLGDIVGDLMVCPLVLLWSADWRLRFGLRQAGEGALILLAVVTTGFVMFGGFLSPYPVTFLCVPLLLWPAFRLGPREAATSAVVLAVIAVAAVVAERKRLEARLLHLADYDSLTEVLSRRRFKEELARELAEARRYDTPAALLFFDVDDFKAINDRVGHAGGDRVLSRVARLVRGRLRDSDLMGRLGGDEFAVLLPRADGAQASAVADQLLKAIGSHKTVVGVKSVVTSASIGIALLPDHGTSAEDLLAHADAAMFAAKAAGGNRYRTYAPG